MQTKYNRNIIAGVVGVCVLFAVMCYLIIALRSNEQTLIEEQANIEQLDEYLSAIQTENNEVLARLEKLEKNEFHVNMRIIHLMAQVKNLTPSSRINTKTDKSNSSMDSLPILCSPTMTGWTVVQRRMDGSVNFTRSWTDYVDGFGDRNTEFFIGLERLHQLTNSKAYQLLICLTDFRNITRHASYSEFAVGNKTEFYELKTLGSYSGNADDSLNEHLNMKFSTPDKDNDKSVNNCALDFKSGWWYKDCYKSNLNGVYTTVDTDKNKAGINWKTWHEKPLKFTQMLIRPNKH